MRKVTSGRVQTAKAAVSLDLALLEAPCFLKPHQQPDLPLHRERLGDTENHVSRPGEYVHCFLL